MSATRIIIILSTTLLLFTGCGSNSSSSNSSTGGSSAGAGQSGNIGGTPIHQPIIFNAGIDSSSFFNAGNIVNYNNSDNTLEFTVPFPLAALLPDSSGTLPNHPDIAFRTDASDKTLTISVPVSKYIDLVKNPTTLPDGRPLPGITGGEPPSFGFPVSFSGKKAYAYVAFDSFSIFIESGSNLPINFEVPIKSRQDESTIGSVYWLPPLNSFSGGVFVSLRLPKALSVFLANAQ